VLYSHRSNFLHTLRDHGRRRAGHLPAGTVLPVVPMFHANAWGCAFPRWRGAKLVMPGAKLDGASMHELLESEQVTFTPPCRRSGRCC
jgi:fatty-acyl-CoA synthase